LFKDRRALDTSTVNFDLDELSAYASHDNVDEAIALLMEEIGAYKGDNIPIDGGTLYTCTSGI